MNKIYLLTSLILLLALSCTKTNIDPELIINVDDEFTLDLWEDLESSTPTFNFLFETIKEYSCEDNTIKYKTDPRESIVVITLEQIDQKSDCAPGLAPASALVPIEKKEGNFSIRIKLKESIINEGSLSITPEKYSFSLNEDAVGINLVRNDLYRVPKGTIWGYINYQATDHKTHADGFLNDIEQLSSISNPTLTPGYYGHFNVDEQQTFSVNGEEVPAANAVHFVKSFSGNIQDLQAKAQSISEQSGGKAEVSLFWFL